MKGKLLKRFDSISYKIVVILILLVMPLNILVILSTTKSITAIQEQACISAHNVLNLYTQDLESRISTGNYFLYDLSTNNADFIRLTMQKGDGDYNISKTRVADTMSSQLSSSRTVNGYFYYAKELDDSYLVMPSAPEGFSALSIFEVKNNIKEWLKKTDLDQYGHWTMVEIEDYHWFIRVLKTGDFYYGMIISLDEVATTIESELEYETTQVLLNENSDEKGYITVTDKLDNNNLTLTIMLKRLEVIQSLPLLQWVAIVLACLYFLLIPVLILVINKMIIRPLNSINTALTNLKKGQRDYRIGKHNYAVEFNNINESFNDMADSINRLKIENYEKQLQQQRMELKNLQLQIHPHFLLNMFNLVHSLAQVADYQNIQKLALYLSNYFRYIFRSGHDTESFEQELKLIKQYLDISKIRYPVSFEVEYDVEEEAKKVLVPPLLIHNFVENILKHAIKPNQLVHILIVAHYADDWVEFSIIDDGIGMPESITEAINNEQFDFKKDDRVHVGISNSLARIRYLYGKESSITVESEENMGTCFIIRYPFKLEENA